MGIWGWVGWFGDSAGCVVRPSCIDELTLLLMYSIIAICTTLFFLIYWGLLIYASVVFVDFTPQGVSFAEGLEIVVGFVGA